MQVLLIDKTKAAEILHWEEQGGAQEGKENPSLTSDWSHSGD